MPGVIKKRKEKKPCACLTCPDAKPFDDGQAGLICDRTLEACFMDCDNCAAWACTLDKYRIRKAKEASRELHTL